MGVKFNFIGILIPTISLNGSLSIYLFLKFIMTSFNCTILSFFLFVIAWSFNSVLPITFSSVLLSSLSSILVLSSSTYASKLFILFSRFLTLLANILSSGSSSTSCFYFWLFVFKHEIQACFKYLLHVNLFSWLG
jgi:hypothetical protein